MRIEAISRRKIVVELNAEDLSSLDITYEALDYASAETRRVIWVILDKVRESTGCDIDPSGQLLIDAMPRPSGGCVLFFTMRGGAAEPFGGCAVEEKQLRRQTTPGSVFVFADIDALLDCAAAAGKAAEPLFSESELYMSGDGFALLVAPLLDSETLCRFFGEYARFRGDDGTAASEIREHWMPTKNFFSPKKTSESKTKKAFIAGSIYV